MRVQFKTDYNQDIRLAKHGGHVFWYGLALIVLLASPYLLDMFMVSVLTRVLILAIAGLGLMLLTGYTGQVSLGHVAFLGIGAYTNAWFLGQGFDSFVAIAMATILTSICGLILALPASRLSGLYLAITTLSFAIIVEHVFKGWSSVTGGNRGMVVEPPTFFGYQMWDATELYYLTAGALVAIILVVLNLLRSPIGRAMVAVRDSEISARSLGIPVGRVKAFAFAVSAGITGIAGALFSHFLQYLSPETFGVILSAQLLLLIVIGGLGTVQGAIYGAFLIGLLETFITFAKDVLPGSISMQPGLEPMLFGLVLVGFIIFEPTGVYGRWMKIKSFLETFPYYRRKSFQRQRSYLKTEKMQ